MPAAEKVKQVAKDEVNRAAAIAQEAATSGAYLYPIKGIYYYISHRDLWRPLASQLLPTLGMGVGILGSMFFFTYLPQAAVLAFFNGPLAAVSAALLVLSESSTIFMTLAKTLLVEDKLIDTFDGTLVARGQTALVATDRKVGSGRDSIARLGKLVSKPFAKFTPTALVRYIMYLPLNFIPVVGTVLFVLAQGRKAGPGAHSRYFQLKSMSKTRKEEFVDQRKGAYTAFGTVATLLEMVPIAGIFFAFTNVTGAALWAADMEANGGTSPELKEQAKKATGPEKEL